MKKNFIILISLISLNLSGKDYVIYSIDQDFPMGNKGEVLKKNYFINIGENQGIRQGTLLNVYRSVFKINPQSSKQTHNHFIKVGKIRVLHVDQTSSIAKKEIFLSGQNTVHLEIKDFIIGDKVDVDIHSSQ